jgi:hypothetical protein
MAHWAEIDQNNIVIRVIVGNNDDPNGDEGYQWILDNLGGTWIKTSYNRKIRKNFAGIGFTYDADFDAFIPPKPYPSWLLDEKDFYWKPPKPEPIDGFTYAWNEETLDWRIVDFSKPDEAIEA